MPLEFQTIKNIYNSAKDYIDNHQDLLSYFTQLMEIKEDESIVNSIEYPHTIIIKFTPQKLLNANLTNDLSSHYIISCLNEIFDKACKDKVNLI